jgi:hypothetical protein
MIVPKWDYGKPHDIRRRRLTPIERGFDVGWQSHCGAWREEVAEVAPGRQARTSPEVDNLFRIGKLKRAPAADGQIVGLPQSAEDRPKDAVPRQGTWRFRGGRL